MKKTFPDIFMLLVIFWLGTLSNDFLKTKFEASLISRVVVNGVIGALVFALYRLIIQKIATIRKI